MEILLWTRCVNEEQNQALLSTFHFLSCSRNAGKADIGERGLDDGLHMESRWRERTSCGGHKTSTHPKKKNFVGYSLYHTKSCSTEKQRPYKVYRAAVQELSFSCPRDLSQQMEFVQFSWGYKFADFHFSKPVGWKVIKIILEPRNVVPLSESAPTRWRENVIFNMTES